MDGSKGWCSASLLENGGVLSTGHRMCGIGAQLLSWFWKKDTHKRLLPSPPFPSLVTHSRLTGRHLHDNAVAGEVGLGLRDRDGSGGGRHVDGFGVVGFSVIED